MTSLEELLIHPATRKHIEVFLSGNSHALLLTANHGSGKETVLRAIAKELGAIRDEQLFVIGTGQEGLGIEEIRGIRSRLKLRPYENDVTVVLLLAAERMSREAANALLKLLEEPPAKTYFFLSAPSNEALLSTITSRATSIKLHKVPRQDVIEFFRKKGFTEPEIEKAYVLTNGLVGSILSILQNDEGNITETIPEAKKVLSSTLLDRLKMIDSMSKDKKHVEKLLDVLEKTLYAGFQSAVSQQKNVATWANKLETVAFAQDCFRNNVSTKILLTRLMLFV